MQGNTPHCHQQHEAGKRKASLTANQARLYTLCGDPRAHCPTLFHRVACCRSRCAALRKGRAPANRRKLLQLANAFSGSHGGG